MIRAKWVNGRAVPEEDVDWPEGSVVFVSRALLPESEAADLVPQGDDPESIVKWLAWYDSLEPLIYAPGEEAEIDRVRQNIADYTRQHADRQIEGMFE